MAKIRVYELARDLDMKSKALLEKLKDMNISVGSHVSSLDDDTVAKIRANFSAAKPDSAKVTSAKPRVIRRPKKQSPEKSAHTENGSESLARDPGTHSPDADLPAEIKQDQVSEAKADEQLSEKEGPREKSVPGSDQERRTSQSDVGNEAVSSPGPSGKEEGESSDKQINDSAKKHESADLGKEKSDTQAPGKKTSAKKDESSQKKQKPTLTKHGKPGSQPPKGIKSKKRKKRKKETPAKIIKLPTKAEEEALAREVGSKSRSLNGRSSKAKTDAPERRSVSDHVADGRRKPALSERKGDTDTQQKESSAKDKKRKPWRKGVVSHDVKPEEDKNRTADKKSKDIKWTKKKISFKRKEVVEGSALYARGNRGRRSRKGGKVRSVKAQSTQITIPKAIKRRVKVDETIVLSDLAKRMGIKANEMIKKLMMLGVMVTVNQTIDFDTAVLVASEFNYEVEKASFEEDVILHETEKEDPSKLMERPPVVTIMGHVDHGKTSLLDVIRKTRITEIEAGGITQHIGAYNVSVNEGQITFLDTPGHEAFTAMRARGAKVTDLVVLVVAADDGVMPQTIEAINHSKAAKVPIIVAVNKIDKANADTDRVYRELSEQGLVPEDWGGDTIFVKVSAKQNQGIDSLLEMILLQSEVLELKANPDKLALGYVVEAKLDSGRGAVATVLIQEGTLRAGNPVVCGIHHGKIRAMLNDRGVQVESAGPSEPVEILGLSGVPNAGDELISIADEKSAKQVSEHRVQKQRSKELAKTSRMSLEKLFERMQEGEVKDLNLIIRADVHGSIEALSDSLVKLSNEEVAIHVIHSATGTITESDVSLAAVSDAIIIGFNVRPSPKVQALANEEHVDMRFYNVIYNVIKDIQDAILGMMESTYEDRLLGRAEVREVFHVPKIGAIAGSYVLDGKIERGKLARLLRDGVICYDGKLASLRRFKDDVKEVHSGYECGIGIENYNDIKVGDIIECYYLEEIRPEL